MNTSRQTVGFKTAFLPFSPRSKSVAVVCSLAALIALSGCGKKEDGLKQGQSSNPSMSSTDQSGRDAKANADASMTKPADSSTSTSSPTAIVNSGTQSSMISGSGTQAMSAGVDDLAITASIAAGFAKDADLSAIKIDVDTKGGVVSLIGPAPSVEARDRATTIVKGVKGVKSVDNKLVIKGS